jgi:hypothetical protein
MQQLSETDTRWLERLDWTQRVATWVGLVLAVLGAVYVGWGIYLFDYRVDPRTQSSFDGPVSQLAFLYDGYQRTLDKITPETPVEQMLMEGAKRGMYFSSGVMVMMMRIYLGTLVCLMGLVSLTVVIERRRLLRVISKLRV